ncbi:MAG: 30S ribosomal protein S14, partial [Moorea sp. SIO2B7]|nr:30S ribosomal protein S14 [Moorena sp. SIO2B7]
MAKKSMIEREKKRGRLVEKYAEKRENLKEQFRTAKNPSEKLEIHRKIQQLPRNSAPNRRRNRCWVTGRPRGYYRDFGFQLFSFDARPEVSTYLVRGEVADDALEPLIAAVEQDPNGIGVF